MNSVLFFFLLIGAPFFWWAVYSFLKKSEKVPIKEGVYLSIYSMVFVYLLFITQ